MRPFVTLSIILLCATTTIQAQTYLERLQKKLPGLGTVTVHQSKALDELVNGKEDSIKKVTPPHHETTPTVHERKTPTAHERTTPATTEKNVAAAEKKNENNQEETETPVVDMSKKVMRSSYKVTGYRVQAYAGGNSRADRQKAEQIGNAIKMKFPDQPVYVHFYSPRWICRVGNYRTQAEASAMLKKIRAMGYKQACLVKGKITVTN